MTTVPLDKRALDWTRAFLARRIKHESREEFLRKAVEVLITEFDREIIEIERKGE